MYICKYVNMHTAHPHEYILTLRTQHAGGSSKDPISLSRCSVCVAVCVAVCVLQCVCLSLQKTPSLSCVAVCVLQCALQCVAVCVSESTQDPISLSRALSLSPSLPSSLSHPPSLCVKKHTYTPTYTCAYSTPTQIHSRCIRNTQVSFDLSHTCSHKVTPTLTHTYTLPPIHIYPHPPPRVQHTHPPTHNILTLRTNTQVSLRVGGTLGGGVPVKGSGA